MKWRGYSKSLVFFLMILIISGVVCGEGLRIVNNVDSRTQKGGSWGLGGLSSSPGLLTRSLQYNSDMNRTGIGSRARDASGITSVGGMSGGYNMTSSSRNSSITTGTGMNSLSAGADNTKYAPKTVGDLKPTDIGKYNMGADYKKMLESVQENLRPDIGKYEISSAGDVSWDTKDTLESQLAGDKKYGMKMDVSIARSDAYMEALVANGYLKDEKKEIEDSSRITTLVPKNGGEFSELIRRGEEAFKKEQYQESLSFFKLARRISPRSPEVLLSLFHASFAASSGLSYSLPAYYLQLSLKYFPELPLIDVQPKYFYGREGDFVRDQVRLENYIEEQSRDPQALFVMGYVYWRNGNVANACKNLQNSFDLTLDDELKEAIEIMWDGMMASGKVKEKLVIAPPKKAEIPASAPASK